MRSMVVLDIFDKGVAITYYIGTLLIVLTTIWIIILYIYKLFQVMRYSQKVDPERANKTKVTEHTRPRRTSQHRLLPTISKYTVLAIFSILSSILFWIVAILRHGGFEGLFLYHLCLFIDVTVNLICFVLGYAYTNSIYHKYCDCIDNGCRIFCSKMVLFSVGVRMEEINKSVNAQPNVPNTTIGLENAPSASETETEESMKDRDISIQVSALESIPEQYIADDIDASRSGC